MADRARVRLHGDELAAGTYEAVRGTVRCVDLLTGEERGAFANERAGYYWAGGVAVGGLYLVADDRGTVTALRAGPREGGGHPGCGRPACAAPSCATGMTCWP